MRLLNHFGAAALGALVFALFWWCGFHAPYVVLWEMCLLGAVLGLMIRALVLMPPLRGYTRAEVITEMRRAGCSECTGSIKTVDDLGRCRKCGGQLFGDGQL